jgi:hypothetical protein
MYRSCCTVLAIVVFLGSLASANPTGQILGTVRDANGLVTPGAVVVIMNDHTGQRSEIRSNDMGDWLSCPVSTHLR